MNPNEITIRGMREHQLPIYNSPKRFKVVRAGRRFGKDVLADAAALIGHGPKDTDGVPLLKGLIHGKDIVWMAPTIPQTNALWKNEIEPRYRNRQHIAVNQVEKTVTLLNRDGTAFATLWVRSAEAANSVRGIGNKLGGVIINEAAWLDLEHVWRDILRPALMDCGGWALIMSTTNAGPDGHENEGGKRTPSFFNLLCEEIMQEKRDEDWGHFYGTAADNPLIDPEEFHKLVREYPSPEDPTCQQEVFANLIVGGSGVAFPEWNHNIHVTDYEPRSNGRWSGGGDWGYRSPGVLYHIWTGSERSLVRFEYKFSEKTPYQVGYTYGKLVSRWPLPEWIAVDTPAVSDGGPEILHELQRGMNDALGPNAPFYPAFINPPKGPGSRHTKKILLHQALKYSKDKDGNVPVWARPALQVHSDCGYLVTTLPKLPRDPKGKDDVDTSAEDHAYDGICSWLMARAPYVERQAESGKVDEDTHPGWVQDGDKIRVAEVPHWDFVNEDTPRWSRSPA